MEKGSKTAHLVCQEQSGKENLHVLCRALLWTSFTSFTFFLVSSSPWLSLLRFPYSTTSCSTVHMSPATNCAAPLCSSTKYHTMIKLLSDTSRTDSGLNLMPDFILESPHKAWSALGTQAMQQKATIIFLKRRVFFQKSYCQSPVHMKEFRHKGFFLKNWFVFTCFASPILPQFYDKHVSDISKMGRMGGKRKPAPMGC